MFKGLSFRKAASFFVVLSSKLTPPGLAFGEQLAEIPYSFVIAPHPLLLKPHFIEHFEKIEFVLLSFFVRIKRKAHGKAI